MTRPVLMAGFAGDDVGELKRALAAALGDDAAAYPGLAAGDVFDADTGAALRCWQSACGLVADGIAGPRVGEAIGLRPALPERLTVAAAGHVFPYTRTSNIERQLPYVLAALSAYGLGDRAMTIAALATIRAETEGFVPIAEAVSHFNTKAGAPPFGAYERRLGNRAAGDGARYRGRGYVQLTGRANYARFGAALGIDLVGRPELACAPEVAACLLAAFLQEHAAALRAAFAAGDARLDEIRRLRKRINGGAHGLQRFAEACRLAQAVWPAAAAAPHALAAPATTGDAPATEAPPVALTVRRDKADLRDRPYAPPPLSLPAQYPDDAGIADFSGRYADAGLVLDQGAEGACTGFGLAGVINFLRWRATGMPRELASASPRMLYHFARRYDEYEGESYEGSSCRGALKAWHRHGVCLEARWPYEAARETLPRRGWDAEAIELTLGVYYRIDTGAIADLQAAIREVGAIYVSCYTHAGWRRVPTGAAASHAQLPRIAFDGRPSKAGGHAFALVGFNRDGFVLQNSWGADWGAGGFAVLAYADWLANAMDAWVAAIGVPGVVGGRLASLGGRGGAAGAADQPGWWDEDRAYRHSIVIGNDGRVARHLTQDAIQRRLDYQAGVLPDRWFRDDVGEVKRLLVFAHGGLNSEDAAIDRVQAMGRYFLGNGCYPLFLVWKTGFLESLLDVIEDRAERGPAGRAGGVVEWLTDIGDAVLETTIARPFARPLWREMKENAELAARPGRGADLFAAAVSGLAATWGDRFELHLVGHSAGAILLGHLLDALNAHGLGERVRSLHLYAPACTVEFANRHFAPDAALMSRLRLDVLDDELERNDSVAAIYRKSLLYLVSNALEDDPRMPLLGLAKIFDAGDDSWDGTANTAEALLNWRTAAARAGLQRRTRVQRRAQVLTRLSPEQRVAAGHQSFDNDVELVARTIEAITGAPCAMPVDDLSGF